MIDLPQHAGQVALLRDLALGRSPWAGEVQVNLATPYLIGYGLAFPLAFLMPVVAALKTVLTAAYAAFIAVCIGIGRELGASRKLDAYYAFSFFGFAHAWGMYTFLVAAPVGLAFIWLCIRYARSGGAARGFGLAALGIALLLSHGLLFLFAAFVGGLILLVRATSLRSLIVQSWPFWILLAAGGALFMISRQHEAAIVPGLGNAVLRGPLKDHLAAYAFNAFGATFNASAAFRDPWLLLGAAFFVGAPLLAGLRPDWRRREALVIAIVVTEATLLAPEYAWGTALLYERFALFIPPAYAWLLREGPRGDGLVASRLRPWLGLVAGAACAAVLVQHARLQFEFGREQRDFEDVLVRAAPGQRALAMIFDPASDAGRNPAAYLHHALWYQAERSGFVDFNFAMFRPQITRFRPGHVPALDDRLAWTPQKFDWRANGGDRYRYFFMRTAGPPPATVFAGAPCAPAEIVVSGRWRLYERGRCVAR